MSDDHTGALGGDGCKKKRLCNKTRGGGEKQCVVFFLIAISFPFLIPMPAGTRAWNLPHVSGYEITCPLFRCFSHHFSYIRYNTSPDDGEVMREMWNLAGGKTNWIKQITKHDLIKQPNLQNKGRRVLFCQPRIYRNLPSLYVSLSISCCENAVLELLLGLGTKNTW